jgi:hypothetical protein
LKFRLVEMEELSGNETRIYSVEVDGAPLTLFEQFIIDNDNSYTREIDDLYTRLETIGKDCGLFEEFFESAKGKFLENICAFKDRPKSWLRLYFIEYGNRHPPPDENGVPAIILGGGGPKPKNAKTSQEVPLLDDQLQLLGKISNILQKAAKKGQFKIEDDGSITGKVDFNSEDYD